MLGKLRGLWNLMREVRTGNLEPQVREVLAREEENGARALLFVRLLVFVFFIIGGTTASPDVKDIVSNLVFAAAYGTVIFMQWYLLRCGMHRALHRFNFFLILADHALFAGLLIFYYTFYSQGNFNHAMKSPYMILLLLPTITTLVQFRHTLLFFSFTVVVGVILAFFGFAKLSGAPQTTNWLQYILGDAIIYPAWLGVWLLLPTMIAAIVGYAIFRSIRMVSEIGKIESQKMQLARYFSPDVVEEISAGGDGENAFKKGERRAVAVLFADIRSFTTLSENMPPDLVADMLSELRQLQIRAVFENHGMVDKFIGDAIMAVFGAPRSAGNFAADVNNAVRCGLKMHESLGEFNSRRGQQGKAAIRLGIGIHAGEVFAGNLGGEGQLEYTVIGDVVNTASRIEHLCKKAQADFLVSETVAHELTDSVLHQRIGRVIIRGRAQPMGIHKVIH